MSVPIAPGLSVPLESEHERLRAANYELRKMASIFSNLFVHAEEECERLEALNAELLAALKLWGMPNCDCKSCFQSRAAIAKAESRS